MTNNDSTIHKREYLFIGSLAFVAMVMVALAAIPSARVAIKNSFMGSERTVLAKVEGPLTEGGRRFTVLKILHNDTLNLEFFAPDDTGTLSLILKAPLFDRKDGHFLLNGNATNLALTDVDKDGTREVLAPTFDDQMVPRLNIFKFNNAETSFERMTAPEDYKP